MDDATLEALDSGLEELRRRLRVRLRREMHRSGGEFIGGGMHILSYLVRAGSASPSEIADSLEVRTSTMAAHLDRLEAAGYVRRAPRANGTRVDVRLTPLGEAAHARYLDTRRQVLREVLSPLDEEERVRLADLLGRLGRTAAAQTTGQED